MKAANYYAMTKFLAEADTNGNPNWSSVQRDGETGALFKGPDEPRGGTFIPFSRLLYNSQIGFYSADDGLAVTPAESD